MLESLWQSILLAFSLFSVGANTETAPSPFPGDSLDDIAIWVNKSNPEDSLILATLKQSNQAPPEPVGILVYSLEGKQLQFLEGGSPNNIDIRYGYSHEGKTIAVIAVSHWWHNYVSLLTIDPTNLKLIHLTAKNADTGLHQTRGLCLFKDANQLYYFVTNSLGEVRQFMVNSNLHWSIEQVRHFKLDSNAEGCVADDDHGTLYIAEESSGIWKYDARPGGDRGEKIASLSWLGSLRANLEGMTIYDSGNGKGYFLVSSQDNSRYAIFDRVSNKQLETFRIEANGKIDGTSKSDGIDVSSVNYGPRFPSGFFIAHDDKNKSPDGSPQHQNFKVVDWRLIQKQIDKIAGK